MGEERKVHKVLVGNPRKETTQKTEAWMGGWDRNVSWGDWLGEGVQNG
jgi:hypothetical protein